MTNDNFWDCECEEDYIHPKSETSCNICGAEADESPDSISTEVSQKFQKGG
jgi:hypothetical protein